MDNERESDEEERASAPAASPSNPFSDEEEEDEEGNVMHEEMEVVEAEAEDEEAEAEDDTKKDVRGGGSDTEDEDGIDDDDDEDDEEEGFVVAVAERNRHRLSSGCGRQAGGERRRVERAFWTALWPLLEDVGWSKDEGRGKDEGLAFFKTPDQLEEYDRIKDVIDRVLLRKDPAEALAADAYEAHLAQSDAAAAAAATAAGAGARGGATSSSAARRAAVLPISRNRKKKGDSGGGDGVSSTSSSLKGTAHPPGGKGGSSKAGGHHQKSAGLLDASWKEGGKSFPKRSSAVGSRYQVSRIPAAGTYDPDASEQLCTLIWSPAQAEARGVNDATIADLLPGIKEVALFRLAELGYDETALLVGLKSIKPADGSTWGQERRERFRDEIFRSRKDFKTVCRTMRISMKMCLAYYYGTFKYSDDYRLLKTVCCEEDAMRLEANEHEFDACAVCGDGGNLLICDGCEGEYHMECCRPALRHVPEGNWLCDECVDRKFLAARQYVIKSSRLFERHQRYPDDDALGPNGKKRTLDDMRGELPEGVEKVLYKPTEAVLSAVRKFAKGLNQLLATGKVSGDGTTAEGASVPEGAAAAMEGATTKGNDEQVVKDEAMEGVASMVDAPDQVEVPALDVPAVEGTALG